MLGWPRTWPSFLPVGSGGRSMPPPPEAAAPVAVPPGRSAQQHPPVLWFAYANRWGEPEQSAPSSGAQPFLVASLQGPIEKPPAGVMGSLSGWTLTTDGGLQGVQVLSVGFIFDAGRVYELIYSDICTTSSAGQQTGLHYLMQRTMGRFEKDRDPQSGLSGTWQWGFPYITEIGLTDNLVVNASNTNNLTAWTIQSARMIIREVVTTPP